MTDRPIDVYLGELRRELGRRPDVDDVVAEVEDHLREVAAWHAGQGMQPETAELHALSRFGRATLVARAFDGAGKGAAVPTTSTRSAGVASSLGAIVVAVSFALRLASESWERGWFPEVAGLGALLVVVGLVGMHVRQRAAYGSLGRVGFGLLIVGTALSAASVPTWFVLGQLVGFGSIGIGACGFLAATWRTAILPRPTLAVFIAGLAGIVASNAVPEVVIAPRFTLASYLATAALAIACSAWAWMGLIMWRERAAFDDRLPDALA